MRITLEDYFMGRDERYKDELTPRIRDNAALTVERVNALLVHYQAATGAGGDVKVNSGWRPPAVNKSIGGKPASRHMSGEACDLADPSNALDAWLMTDPGFDALAECGLWIEHPSVTLGWTHLQTQPPKSGRRAFFP